MNILDKLLNRELGLQKFKDKDLMWKYFKPYQSHDANIGLIYSCRFCPIRKNCHLIAAASEDGYLTVRSINSTNIIYEVRAHTNAVSDIVWVNDEYILTGSGDTSIRLWKLGQAAPIHEFTGHCKTITCISCQPNTTVTFASASRDGRILMWDMRNHSKCMKLPLERENQMLINSNITNNMFFVRPEKEISQKYDNQKRYFNHNYKNSRTRNFRITEASVSCISYQNENTLISTTPRNSLLNVWDIRFLCKKPIYYLSGKCITWFTLSPCKTKLYAQEYCGNITMYNIGSDSFTAGESYEGHRSNNFFLRNVITSDGEYLISNSNDAFVYIWSLSKKIKYPIFSLKGEMSNICCVDCNLDSDLKIVTTVEEDTNLSIWRCVPRDLNNDIHVNSLENKHSESSKSIGIEIRKQSYNIPYCIISSMQKKKEKSCSFTTPTKATCNNKVSENPIANLPDFINGDYMPYMTRPLMRKRRTLLPKWNKLFSPSQPLSISLTSVNIIKQRKMYKKCLSKKKITEYFKSLSSN